MKQFRFKYALISFIFQDELFAFSEKFILKAEDLVCLLEDEVRWMWGQRLYQEDELEGEVTNSEEFDQRMTIRDFGMNLSDVDKEKEIIGIEFFLVYNTTFNTVQ